MRVFKQEQMHMVDEYFSLRQRDGLKERRLAAQSRCIQQQERIIEEMTAFAHDSLGQIFQRVQ